MLFTCSVNSVGLMSGGNNPFDPGGRGVLDPAASVNLTDLGGMFENYMFLVNQTGLNGILAVGLAAVNTGFQVSADVDWPPPDPDSGDAAMCWSLFINSP
jgi:hypothetical protein